MLMNFCTMLHVAQNAQGVALELCWRLLHTWSRCSEAKLEDPAGDRSFK